MYEILLLDKNIRFFEMIRWLTWQSVVRGDEAFHVARSFLEGPRGLHAHDFAEVFWVAAGAGRHLLHGGESPLTAGDLVCMRPEDAHDYAATPGLPLHLVNLAFPRDTLDFLRRRYPDTGEQLWPQAGRWPRQYRLAPALLAELDAEADALAAYRGSRLALERFLLNLAWRLREAAPGALAPPPPPWLRQALTRFRESGAFVEGVPALVRLAGRSHAHVTRAIHAHCGQTPSALVQELRLEHAAGQLVLTQHKVADVAHACGYASVAHFYACFQARYGETPRQYRQRHLALIR